MNTPDTLYQPVVLTRCGVLTGASDHPGGSGPDLSVPAGRCGGTSHRGPVLAAASTGHSGLIGLRARSVRCRLGRRRPDPARVGTDEPRVAVQTSPAT